MRTRRSTRLGNPAADDVADVWSRTAPRYRRRAVWLLGVTIALFAGLCCFTYWLRTGQYTPWSDRSSYVDLMWKSFNPRGGNQVTLVDFLLFPISVEQVPIQWVIMGLLLASLSSVPILVAILYRFPASVIFALMVGAIAAMPWLAITILMGCAVASMRPFRLSFRYASALLGLVPVALYFISATRQPEDTSFLSTPFRAKLAAPWVLAVLGSCVICAVALAIARLINYRPGGIAPLLAVLFALPVLLFHSLVGRDELDYRVLEEAVGPGSERVFAARSMRDEVERDAQAAWSKDPQIELNAMRQFLMRERREAVIEREWTDRQQVLDRCNAFLERYAGPEYQSRYVPNVLYLMGRALDQRLDRELLDGPAALVRYYAGFPRPESRGTWKTLEDSFPGSDLSAIALYRQAQLDAMQGALEDAVRRLDMLIERFDRLSTTRPAAAESAASVFGKPKPSTSLGFEPARVLSPARQLRELILLTRDDPRYGDAPLRELLALDPRGAAYGENLARLLMHHPGAAIELSSCVRLAERDVSLPRAIESLRKLADASRDDPCNAECLWRLGALLESNDQLAAAQATLERIPREYPESCYVIDARQRLSLLSALSAR